MKFENEKKTQSQQAKNVCYACLTKQQQRKKNENKQYKKLSLPIIMIVNVLMMYVRVRYKTAIISIIIMVCYYCCSLLYIARATFREFIYNISNEMLLNCKKKKKNVRFSSFGVSIGKNVSLESYCLPGFYHMSMWFAWREFNKEIEESCNFYAELVPMF